MVHDFRANTLRRLLFVTAFGTLLLCSAASCEPEGRKNELSALNPGLSPLADGNRDLLFRRLAAAFDQRYARHLEKNRNRNFSTNFRVYYLRQELQALIDMWRATGRRSYLDEAKKLVLEAIKDSMSNRRPLLLNRRQRGTWPCFESKASLKSTGGHNQINDFQGAAGFLMVAVALKQAGQDGSKEIADFVETNIVEKWLYYRPSVTPNVLAGPRSNRYLLVALDSARDKREHFAAICLDLDRLGYSKHRYGQWGRFLVGLYAGTKRNLDQPAPRASELGSYAPADWGLVHQESTGALVWYYVPNWRLKKQVRVLDTSHANRTVWLATQAYEAGLVDKSTVERLSTTLKKVIWKPDKGPFYFSNILDGSDVQVQNTGPGRKGNVWFGWHRLAAYDASLHDLFVSLGYDLVNGGKNIPEGAQNKSMANAPLCLIGWAARLLSPSGVPSRFP